jgi:hypothetical protein
MSWLQKLKDRWNVGSIFQVVIILIVFACTGFTVMFIARPILNFLFAPNPVPVWGKIIYYILILPIYNIILLGYGFIFGQFRFFLEFEKRFFRRMLSGRQKGK